MSALLSPLSPGMLTSIPSHRSPLPRTRDPQAEILSNQVLDRALEVLKLAAEQSAMTVVSRRLTTRLRRDPFVRRSMPMVLTGSLVESAEVRWLAQNSQDIEERYRGEWLLIRGHELLAHSRDFGEIEEAIIRERVGSPFVYYVLYKTYKFKLSVFGGSKWQEFSSTSASLLE